MASDTTNVTKAELCRLLDYSTTAVSQWVSKGCPYVQKGSKSRQWIFDVPAVVAWREEQAALQAVGDTKSLDIDEARRRKLASEAAMLELELAKRKGELVEIDAVAEAVGDDYANLRAKLLSIPVKLSPQIIGITQASEAQQMFEDLIYEALEELVSDGIYTGPEKGTEGAEESEPQAAA